MVVDCFTFFNEIELLEFRLEFLNGYVDKFVIAEANITYSGKDKPYNFELNQKRFEKWKDKIHYIKVNLQKEGIVFNNDITAHTPENGHWKLENAQRNALYEVSSFISDDDIVIVSDIDEIPDPEKIKNKKFEEPLALSQLFHYYFFNCQNNKFERWWNGSCVCNGKYFKQHTPQYIRDNRNNYSRIKKSGWHFSYLGGIEAIQKKIKSFSHAEYNKDEFLNEEHIKKAIRSGKDIFKREHISYIYVPLFIYPKTLRNLMKKYPKFINKISSLKLFINCFKLFFLK